MAKVKQCAPLVPSAESRARRTVQKCARGSRPESLPAGDTRGSVLPLRCTRLFPAMLPVPCGSAASRNGSLHRVPRNVQYAPVNLRLSSWRPQADRIHSPTSPFSIYSLRGCSTRAPASTGTLPPRSPWRESRYLGIASSTLCSSRVPSRPVSVATSSR